MLHSVLQGLDQQTRGFVFKELKTILYADERKEQTFRANLKSLPDLSRQGSLPSWLNCTMVILLNLAHPYFVRIDCEKDLLMHVMCTDMKAHTSNMTYIEISPTDYFCNNSILSQNTTCLNFEWLRISTVSPVPCAVHPEQFSSILYAVQATTFPHFIFHGQMVLVSKHYNFLNYAAEQRHEEGLCVSIGKPIVSSIVAFLGSTYVMGSGIVLMGLMNQKHTGVDRRDNAGICSYANHLKSVFIWKQFVTVRKIARLVRMRNCVN